MREYRDPSWPEGAKVIAVNDPSERVKAEFEKMLRDIVIRALKRGYVFEETLTSDCSDVAGNKGV